MWFVSVGGRGTPTEFLRALIGSAGGSISVERFMQEALYHPVHGYYAQTIRTVGREGDFSTTASLHGVALGRAIAAWAKSSRREMRWNGQWHLIELGGGSGRLASEILRALGWWAGRGLRYHLVEVSKGLRVQQAKTLGNLCQRVQWHDEILTALDAAQGRALIFSNEFVDAFPCVQLERDAFSRLWREVHVAWSESAKRPVEILVDWQGHQPVFAEDGLSASQRVEIHGAYQRWLTGWLGSWRQGRMLTIDYGDRLPALYRRRPRGTLRAYCRQMRFDGLEIYERFGQQDLTADVNFGDLQAWSEELGLERGSISNQAEFLKRWIPPRALADGKCDPVLERLIDPAGAGGAFKVLEQVR